MLRINTCALIFQADKPEKISAIAIDTGTSINEASVAYTIGCIKNMKRVGTARNYKEALDILESRQVGDRGDHLNPPNELSRIVEKINRINKGNTYTPAYVRSTDNGHHWTAIYPANKPESKGHTRNMGKIYGYMYTEQEAREADTDPSRIMHKAELESIQANNEKHLRRYMAEYVSRLSKTYQRRIQEIKASQETSGYLSSRAGRKDPNTKGLAMAIEDMFRSFPHREGLNRREFIDLVRQYAPDYTEPVRMDGSNCKEAILLKRPARG
jgi:hypothetical protein